MNLSSILPGGHLRRGSRAFSFIEILICVAIAGLMFVALYTGITSGFSVIQLARENLRGTQILQEKMETIRLYTWEQLNAPNFIPTNFVENFYATTNSTSGLNYTGTVRISSAPVSENYSNHLKLVEIEVHWISGDILRNREMKTMVGRYGLQNYIY